MSKEKNVTDADESFKESVRKFAEAFLALSDEEKQELQEYVEKRRDEAEEEYNKRTGKK